MSRIPNLSGLTPATAGNGASAGRGNSLSAVNLDQFLQLMITELQNQDPLDPLDNTQLLAQISQIRDIGATDQLTQTLQAVMTGQNVSTASGLIGREIEGLTDDAVEIRGVVDRVTIGGADQQDVKLHVGDSVVSLPNVRDIAG